MTLVEQIQRVNDATVHALMLEELAHANTTALEDDPEDGGYTEDDYWDSCWRDV